MDKEEPKRSQASQLIDLTLGRYRLGLSDERETFAVDERGPNIAVMLRDRDFRNAIAAAYFLEYGEVPSSSAAADACRVLDGLAMQCSREPVALRVASHGGALVFDLGDPEGSAVLISPDAWKVVDRSPVLFRRTKLTALMPQPTRDHAIDDLFQLVNVAIESQPLVLAVLVASLFPDLPHPIVLLTGEHGTGKSTAAKFLFRLVDRSPAELRTAPREINDWVVAASGSWVVTLDNISKIPPALSDALCKASTGDGMVRRQLWSDSGLSVVAFRRVVVLTSIDAGSLRGDFADRLVVIDLERIAAGNRRDERELEDAFSEAYAGLLGALFTLAAEVLAIRDSVTMARSPRMADFGRIVFAIDQVLGTQAFEAYLDQATHLAENLIDDDLVAEFLIAAVDRDGSWTGSNKKLCAQVAAVHPDRGKDAFPTTAHRMAAHLKRLAPTLRTAGYSVEYTTGRANSRTWTIGRKPGSRSSPSSP